MDEARKIIEVNLLGTMICAQAAARLIQQQNHNLPASFVFIASMSGYVVNKGTPVAAYAASKAGVQQLARNLASEWGGNTEAYLKQLQSNPLRTKMLTSGTLSALQELLASWLAHDRSKHGHYFSSRIPKMAIYGAFISAPMGHVLIGFLQWIFAGRTSLKAKILQILTSNLVIAPIQNTVYLASMAVIAGARTWHQIRATVRAGFWPVMKVSWITSPIALAFAQKFLPEQTWVPFFNIVAFCIGTYINTHTKKKRLAALRKKVSSSCSVVPRSPKAWN
ncbi:integral membrane protein, partial [Aureobasidium melanogenum]